MSIGPGRNFFIRHLPEDDPRREQGRVFQVQIVNRHGLAIAFAYLGADDEANLIEGHNVPLPVLAAVRKLNPGEGRFVDSSGVEVLPKDLAASESGETSS